ncbi:hypothetical protein B0I37DRAFT_53253 [Chaetomium sp. MPI-CAGE-AT-0009]|nr:hypothetical protein B0I37DRAFT_53253 [Chaetomium sp. MPI-CAGE-AT-0009]
MTATCFPVNLGEGFGCRFYRFSLFLEMRLSPPRCKSPRWGDTGPPPLKSKHVRRIQSRRTRLRTKRKRCPQKTTPGSGKASPKSGRTRIAYLGRCRRSATFSTRVTEPPGCCGDPLLTRTWRSAEDAGRRSNELGKYRNGSLQRWFPSGLGEMWWRRCPALQLEAPFRPRRPRDLGRPLPRPGAYERRLQFGEEGFLEAYLCMHACFRGLARCAVQIGGPIRSSLPSAAREGPQTKFLAAPDLSARRGYLRREGARGCQQAMLSARFMSDGLEHGSSLLMYRNDWHSEGGVTQPPNSTAVPRPRPAEAERHSHKRAGRDGNLVARCCRVPSSFCPVCHKLIDRASRGARVTG